MKKLAAIAVAFALTGCTTQFGTRLPTHKTAIHAAQHAPAVATPVVVPAPAAPAVAAPAPAKRRWHFPAIIKR